MPTSPSPVHVYLDVAIGDREEAEKQEKAYALTKAFLEATRSTYGWPSSLEEIVRGGESDNETRELFVEAFQSDPQWSGKADCRVDAPNALVCGRLVVELATQAAPKACENFRCLCTGEKGKGKSSGKLLHYKGFKFHRIVKDFVIQGGDIVKNDGSGGDSIYNGAFKDEKSGLQLKHDAVGVVAMANSGPHTNKSQFYLTLKPAPQCDGKHVVVGKLVNEDGISFLEKINEIAATDSGVPAKDVTIIDCGQLK